MLIWMAVVMLMGQKQAEKHKRPMVANNFCFLFSRLNQTLWSPGHPPRSNQLLRHREGIVVEDTQLSCVIY